MNPKLILSILLFAVSLSFALNITIPDEQLAAKHITAGAVDIGVQLTGTPYMYDPTATHHYFLIEVNNSKASAIQINKVLKQNITVNGVHLNAADMHLVSSFTHDNITNVTNVIATPINATATIPGKALTRYVLDITTDPWESGTFNFTIGADGQNILIDPNFSTCGTTTAGSGTYTLTTALSCTGHGITVAHSSVIIDLNGYTMTGDGGAGDYGVNIGTGLNTITVKNGGISTFGYGVYDLDSSIITVQNVTVTSASGTGIYVNANAASLATISITNNTVNTVGSRGIWVKTGASSYTITTATISNNILSGTSTSPQGIYLQAAGGSITGLTVDSNVISLTGATSYMIQLDTSATTKDIIGSITNNNLTGGAGASSVGISISSAFLPPSYDLISGNRISTINGYAITASGASNVNITNNWINNTNGLQISSTASGSINGFEVSNNNITNPNSGTPTGIDMVLTAGSVDNVAISGNYILGFTKGIQFAGAAAGTAPTDTVTNNNIVNGTDGIVINSGVAGSIIFTGNNCTGQSGYGISHTDGDTLQFINTTITNTGNYAYNVAGTVTWTGAAKFTNTSIYSTVGKYISNNGGNAIPTIGLKMGASASSAATWGTISLANAHTIGTTTSYLTNADWLSLDSATLTEFNVAPTTVQFYCADNNTYYGVYYIAGFPATKAAITGGTPTWTYCNNNIATATSLFALGGYAISSTSVTTVGTYDNNITLPTITAPVPASPQALYYDQNGDLQLIYFELTAPTNTIHVAKITNNSLSYLYNGSVNATRPFFVAMRKDTNMSILTYATNNTAAQFINVDGSVTITDEAAAYVVGSNSGYDPGAYANTKNIDTILNDTNSIYTFIVPTNNQSFLISKPYSGNTLTTQNITMHNRIVAWGSIAKDATLHTWYYPWLSNSSCTATTEQIQIWQFDGTTQSYVATPQTACLSQADVEASHIQFEQYGSKTYALIIGLTSATNKLHLIEENLTANLPYTINSISPIIFLDQYTLTFFSNESGVIYAYSCYFGNGANCARIASTSYGQVPAYTGALTAAMRSGTSDIITNGQIAGNLTFAYNQKTYNTKFVCFDEMQEYRKNFTASIFTDNTSQVLTTQAWGYVCPSTMFGAGLTRAYATCNNGTSRLFITGLSNNYTLNMYSLDTTLGSYYSFKVTDAYSQPIDNVTVTAQRISPTYNSFVTIQQAITDYVGDATFFLQPFAVYQISLTHNSYLPITFTFIPSTTASITIILNVANGTVVELPNYNRVFNDTSYSIAPTNTSFAPPDINVTYHVISANSTLEYYGMSITKKYNSTLSTVYSSNVSGNPTGGYMNYTTNNTGVYTVTTWFKSQNYSVYYPSPRTYYIGNVTGLAAARQQLIDEEPISGWLFYLIAVVAAMLVAGFVSQYTIEGAGVVGLIVLWGFTWLYPSAFVIEELGITTFMATALTTVMVIAGVYISKQGV